MRQGQPRALVGLREKQGLEQTRRYQKLCNGRQKIALCRGVEEHSLPRGCVSCRAHTLLQPHRNVLCPSGPRDAASDVPGSFGSIHIVMAASFPPFPLFSSVLQPKRLFWVCQGLMKDQNKSLPSRSALLELRDMEAALHCGFGLSGGSAG